MSWDKYVIDLNNKTINGKKTTNEELLAALYPPRHYKNCPIKDPIIGLDKVRELENNPKGLEK